MTDRTTRKEKQLCDEDCNNCPIISHPNTRLLTRLLNDAHDRFGDEFYAMVQNLCPNLTVCNECRIDDFCHVVDDDGSWLCSITKEP